MFIQNNIAAYNANRILSANNFKVSKNIEKLSSGRKINRSSDDASGLAISEKMRGQIRGLAMAQKNVQDGVSLIQTAEGALAGIQDILHRMRELAVQSSNDTNETLDRDALNNEYMELIREINQTAEGASFNGIKLLDGSLSSSSGQSMVYTSDLSSPINATQTPSSPVNWTNIGGKDYSALAAEIQSSIVPQVINQMKATLPALADFFNSTIEIGLSASRGGSAYASVSYSWGLGPDRVNLNFNINLDEVDKRWNGTGFNTAADRSNFEAMVAHEMTHALMAVATTVGMASPDRYPVWFIEGMAQTMSGDMGWVQHLTGSSTDADIQALLNYGALTKGDASSYYASGYLATMYLAWEAGGGGTVVGATIANGMNKILDELSQGKSLDAVIHDNTNGKYTGLDDFEKYMGTKTDTYNFVRALRNATGSGLGSVLTKDLADTDLVADTGAATVFLNVDTNNAWVTNEYPTGYSPGYGGTAYKDGHPIDYSGPDPYTYVPGSGGYGTAAGPLTIQTGADANEALTIAIEKMDADSIGLKHAFGFMERPVSGTDLMSHDNSSVAISVVNGAINMVSDQRAKLGAYQNRLEFKLQGLAISEENTASAESRIRDADLAVEMTEFVKNGILTDAARAMLGQANAIPQSVLQLLG